MNSIIKLSDYKQEWAEIQGKYQVSDIPVCFSPVSSPYDDYKEYNKRRPSETSNQGVVLWKH